MLSRRLFRCIYTQTSRPALGRHSRTPFRPSKWRVPSPVQRRAYRPINYRHFLTSWNTLRLWIKTPLFYYNVAGISLLYGIFYYSYLERVPVSGRLRFNIVSSHWEEQLAKKLYQEYLDKYEGQVLPTESHEHRTARRVFDQMVPHSGLPEEEWDMVVFDDSDQSAFVLPGGKVFISTGMIDMCRSDDEVASVFGHEMAHNVCHHSSEGISRNIIYVPALLIGWLVTGMDPDLVEFALEVGYRLPGSRAQEREADYLGLLIMAESGYDASASLDLWSRWEEFDKDERPSYLSTHPSHHSRTWSVYSWLKTARQERLSKQSPNHDFHASYFLQRSFCGLNRTPFEVESQRRGFRGSASTLNSSEPSRNSRYANQVTMKAGRYALWRYVDPDRQVETETFEARTVDHMIQIGAS